MFGGAAKGIKAVCNTGMVCSSELDAVLKLPRQWQGPLLKNKVNNKAQLSQRLVVVEVILLTQGFNQELRCQRNPIVKGWILEHGEHPSLKDRKRHIEEQVLPKVFVSPSNSLLSSARQSRDQHGCRHRRRLGDTMGGLPQGQ